jgi:predicted nucleic acid-binding protein
MVLDASVALAWFIDNPIPHYAIHIQQALIHGADAVVPSLWHLEIANGLANAERRRTLSSADLTVSLVQLEKLSGRFETDINPLSARQALSVARSFHLSAYDGAYLETARTNALPIATLDKELRTAATKAGIEIFS